MQNFPASLGCRVVFSRTIELCFDEFHFPSLKILLACMMAPHVRKYLTRRQTPYITYCLRYISYTTKISPSKQIRLRMKNLICVQNHHSQSQNRQKYYFTSKYSTTNSYTPYRSKFIPAEGEFCTEILSLFRFCYLHLPPFHWLPDTAINLPKCRLHVIFISKIRDGEHVSNTNFYSLCKLSNSNSRRFKVGTRTRRKQKLQVF